MILEIKTPAELLNKAYAGHVVASESMEHFSGNLSALVEYLQDGNNEGHLKDQYGLYGLTGGGEESVS